MRTDSRGQSETVGVVLLTAVFVVVSLTVGVFLLSNFDGSNQTEPTVDINADVQGQQLVIEHAGGDSYDKSEIVVIIRSGEERRWRLTELGQEKTTDEGSFSPGDRLVGGNLAGFSGTVDVLVVDEASREILHDSTQYIEVGTLQFENVNVPAEVKQGEKLAVTASLSNTGDVELTQTVTATVTNTTSGAEVYRTETERTIAWNDSKQISFTYTLGQTNTSNLNVELSTEGSRVTRFVDVLVTSELFVTIDESASSLAVTERENISVTAEVDNTGETDLTQTVELLVDGTTQNATEFTVPAGQQTDATLQFPAKPSFDGQLVEITTDDDRDNATLTIDTIGELQIDAITAPDTAQQGEQISVSADLTNTDEVELTQDVEMVLKDESGSVIETKSTEQSVGGGKSSTVSFTDTIRENQVANITAEISTDNETDSRDIEVLTVGELQIDSITAPETAQQGEQITISTDLSNTGEVELTQNIALVLKGESGSALETKSTKQSIGVGESTTVSFSYTISETQTENITAEFSTDNETESREIEVLEVGELQIDSITAPDTAQEGEQITASATLTNTGEADLTQEITFTVSSTNIPDKTTTITVGETEKPVVDHTFQIPYDQTGDITVTVQTADDSASQSVAVADTTLWARGENERIIGFPTGDDDLIGDFTVDAAGSDIDVSVNMDQSCFFFCGWNSYEITIDGSTYQMTTDARDDLVSNTYVDLLDPANYDETGIESELRTIRTRIDSESTVLDGNLADTGELYVEVQEPEP